MTYDIGCKVTAAVRLYETNPIDGRDQCVARPGDIGRVEYVNPRTGCPLVRFERSGWAVDCAPGEVDP